MAAHRAKSSGFRVTQAWIYSLATITKQHILGILGGLNNRNVWSRSSGGWKSEIRVSAGLVSSQASFLGLQMALFSLCPHMVVPGSVSILLSSSTVLLKTPVMSG